MGIKFNNNNNQRNRNYFTMSIEKYHTEDFLKYKNPRELEQDAIKIFRELAQGKINIDEYGEYFYNQALLHALINIATNQYWFYEYSFRGLNNLVDNAVRAGNYDSYMTIVMEEHKNCRDAYQTAYTCLNNFKMSMLLDDLKQAPMLMSAFKGYYRN